MYIPECNKGGKKLVWSADRRIVLLQSSVRSCLVGGDGLFRGLYSRLSYRVNAGQKNCDFFFFFYPWAIRFLRTVGWLTRSSSFSIIPHLSQARSLSQAFMTVCNLVSHFRLAAFTTFLFLSLFFRLEVKMKHGKCPPPFFFSQTLSRWIKNATVKKNTLLFCCFRKVLHEVCDIYWGTVTEKWEKVEHFCFDHFQNWETCTITLWVDKYHQK